jgi:hypothetical protein
MYKIGSAITWILNAIQFMAAMIGYSTTLENFFLPTESVEEASECALLEPFRVRMVKSTSTNRHKVLLRGNRAKVRYPLQISYLADLPERMIARLRPILRSESVSPSLRNRWKICREAAARKILAQELSTQNALEPIWELVCEVFSILYPDDSCWLNLEGSSRDGRVHTDFHLDMTSYGTTVVLDEVKNPTVGNAHMPNIKKLAMNFASSSFARARLPEKFIDHEAIVAKVCFSLLSHIY